MLLVALLLLLGLALGCGIGTDRVKVAPNPYFGPYCSKIELATYRTMSREDKTAMEEEMNRVAADNFPELRERPGIHLNLGTFRLDAPQRALVGIKVDFDSARLRPGEPSPENVYPDWIGCVPLDLREVGGTICTAEAIVITAKVVDNGTGTSSKGAYWRSETLDGDVFLELEEGYDQYGWYIVAEDGSAIARAAKGLGTVGFRVVVAKEGYTTLVRQLAVTANECHIGDVEGDLEFRLVKGPPGEDDVFRKARLLEGVTMHMALDPAPLTAHNATLLRNGKVLVVGGYRAPNAVEVYDPATNRWTPQSALLIAIRSLGRISLEDGRILMAAVREPHTSAELIGSSVGSWGPAAVISTTYDTNTLTLLNDGRILVVGFRSRSAQVYDPEDNRWSQSGSMAVVRLYHTATLLSDGKVLVVGGIDAGSDSNFVNDTAELFDPSLGLWFETGGMGEPRYRHSATLLGDGRVLVVGGWLFRLKGSPPPKSTSRPPEFGFRQRAWTT